jgi:hypothetical protein
MMLIFKVHDAILGAQSVNSAYWPTDFIANFARIVCLYAEQADSIYCRAYTHSDNMYVQRTAYDKPVIMVATWVKYLYNYYLPELSHSLAFRMS